MNTECAERQEEDLEAREALLGGSGDTGDGTLEMEGTPEMGQTGLVVQPLCCGHNKLWLELHKCTILSIRYKEYKHKMKKLYLVSLEI